MIPTLGACAEFGGGSVAFHKARDPVQRRDQTRRRADSRGDELAWVYAEHSRPLLRLAALLVTDVNTAHEVMYEAFAALQQGRGRLRRSDDVFMFLLRAVVHRARTFAVRVSGPGPPDDPGLPNDAVLDALRALPGPQREALVLRYYGQLPDEQAAGVMGVPPAELRANVSRGMAALRSALSPCGHPQPGHMAK